ncbi:dimethylsulfonioproprionate lyase family protein [Mesorhizobium waimense]|uniref:dimethylsulfonioproprionate lyase family protein n=1 Tax=Mesorhizobium waimense TaxID=1300307 RepID=UPI003CCB1753
MAESGRARPLIHNKGSAMIGSEALQYFLDTAFVAFDRVSHDLRSRRSIIQLFAQTEVPGLERARAGSRLPICSYLGSALAEDAIPSALRNFVERFKAIEPSLEWRLKANPTRQPAAISRRSCQCDDSWPGRHRGQKGLASS